MRASKKYKIKYKNCLSHFSVYRPSLKGITIRHPPQAFPLGLLAPRLLGVLLFLAISALRSGGEGRTAVWGEEGILSPASVSSSQMLFGVFSALYCLDVVLRFVTSFNVPSESALAQPLSSFSYWSMWCRFRF
jgi:hypothetical protein